MFLLAEILLTQIILFYFNLQQSHKPHQLFVALGSCALSVFQLSVILSYVVLAVSINSLHPQKKNPKTEPKRETRGEGPDQKNYIAWGFTRVFVKTNTYTHGTHA